MRAFTRSGAALLAVFALSCAPEPSENTGGVSLDEVFGEDGRSCGRGFAVVMTDYKSTNIALLDLEGETASGSFLSSASADAELNAPLSGDVVISSSLASGEEISVLDRYPSSVLTFAAFESGEVESQVSVRTGFNANPQDYLDLGDGRGLVSRYETNKKPGKEAYDEGDDVLILEGGEIAGRLDFQELRDGDAPLRPSVMRRVGEYVVISFTGYESDFSDAATARLGILDVEELGVVGSVTLEGMKNCSALALSPSGTRLAAACSGVIKNSNSAKPPSSGLVVFSVSEEKGALVLEEEARLEASELSSGPLSASVEFANEERILTGTSGALEGEDAGRPDRIWSLSVDLKEQEELLASAQKDFVSSAFDLGDISCAEACAICLVADAGRGVIHRLSVDGDEVVIDAEVVVDTEIDLPPRILGRF